MVACLINAHMQGEAEAAMTSPWFGTAGREESMPMRYEFMWVDISNWEFGRMHKELQKLGTRGWEVDAVVDEQLPAPVAAGRGSDSVSLRLKRQLEN